MPVNRRSFIQTLGAASLLPIASRRLVAGSDREEGTVLGGKGLSLPGELTHGSRIGIASPASGVTRREMREFIKLCHREGFEPVLGRNVSKSVGYLSAPDQDRADELMEFIEDPTIDAVVCARGGYGVMRILPMLDYASFAQANKMVMGFSDITALLIAVNQLSDIVTYHGPVAVSSFDQFTVRSMREVLMPSQTLPTGAKSDEAPYQDDLNSFTNQRLTTIAEGHGRGRLTGGNLSMIVATLGSNYEVNTKGAVLFLEEINEEPYRIDRMLTQLWLAGKLQHCNAIALGNFKNCEAKGISISGPSYKLREVLDDRLSGLGIPVIYGLPFGHVKSKLTLPLGIEAEVDATNKSFRLLEPAVEMA